MTRSDLTGVMRAKTDRRREFALVLRLTSSFKELGHPWQLGNIGFEALAALRVPGIGGNAAYKLHAVGFTEKRVRFMASVTLWPRVPHLRSPRRKRESARAFREWRDEATAALASHGYRGAWRSSPWGRFGDFWKSCRDEKALLAEARRFDGWAEEPPWAHAP